MRWMSRGKCLERFFALRLELPLFLEEEVRGDTVEFCNKLRDPEFLCDMAFLTDITSHLNSLNQKLQGKGQNVSDLYAHMNGFQRKLALFKDSFARNPTLLHFPSCQEMLKDVPERRKYFSKYRKDLETLQQQFTTRFQDLVALQPRLALFTDPLAAVPSQHPPDLQLELCELQSDPFFQTKRNEPAISF